MFNISSFLNNIDGAAKDVLEESPRISATSIRSSRRKALENGSENDFVSLIEENNDNNDDYDEVEENDFENDNIEENFKQDIKLETKSTSSTNSNSNSLTFSNSDNLLNNQSKINTNVDSRQIQNNITTPQKTLSNNRLNETSTNTNRGVGNGIEIELKKTIKQQKKEIEKINAECLEFEDQCSALKLEVREAWDSYKTSQERAAARETELQDEIKQIQKAKSTDKQQHLLQITKLQGDVDEMVNQLNNMQEEKENLLTQIEDIPIALANWKEQERKLQLDLEEARSSSIQGVQSLREELRISLLSMEQIRSDYANTNRNNQARQQEMEQANSELTSTLTEKQREISKLQISLQQVGKDDLSIREIDGLRQHNSTLCTEIEVEKDKIVVLERKLRQIEIENRATNMSWEDEKQRYERSISEMSIQIANFEDKIRDLNDHSGNIMKSPSRNIYQITNDSLGLTMGKDENFINNDLKYEQMEEDINNLATQIQNLSKQLLKKQGDVLELQAERSALKSKVIDLQARCSSAEQQLAYLRDIEDGDYINIETDENNESNDNYVNNYNSFNSQGLQRRSSKRSNLPGSHKMIADLEKLGVKPGQNVTNAVNFVDNWTLITGRFLRNYPLMRIAFVFYLLLLHLWVLVILAVTTHNLEVSSDPKDSLNP